MCPVYDGGIEWDEGWAIDDFRRRLVFRQVEGLEVTEATLEEFLRARKEQEEKREKCPSS